MRTSDIKRLGEAWASVTSKLEEKAVSQQQQKLMGLALAYKRGEIGEDEISPEAKAMADKMSEKDLKDFAKTKHDNLPVKKEENGEEEEENGEKEECPKCEGEGCDHCDGKGYHMNEKTDEAKATTAQKKELAALMRKALGDKRPKPGYTSSIATNGDFVVYDGGMRIVGRIKAGDFTNPMNEDASNDKSDDGEGLDKVDPKAVKKKFKDRKDKDIDNDGDVDSSDEYLHKRRQAISKAVSKESVDASDLIKMLESAAKQQKSNATKPEGLTDKESKGSKDFIAKHKIDKTDESEFDKASFDAASKGTKPKSGKRSQDNAKGDNKIINPVKEDIDVPMEEGSKSLVDMAREQLSGKAKPEDKNPFDGRTRAAREFLERMAKRRGYIKDEKDKK